MTVQLTLNKLALDWFEANKIGFQAEGGIRLKAGDVLLFDEHASLEPYVGFYAGFSVSPMGFMSYTNSTLPIDMPVGRYCSIGRGVGFPRPRHPIEHISSSIFTHLPAADLVQQVIRDMRPGYDNFFPNPEKPQTGIGHDVWIGHGSAIMPGLTIGTGSVVAGHAVVTRSVGPYEIVGGNPARVIRKRFPDEIIARLLASKWWEYRFTDLGGFDVGNPEKFLDAFEKARDSIEPYSPPPIAMMDLVTLIRDQIRDHAERKARKAANPAP